MEYPTIRALTSKRYWLILDSMKVIVIHPTKAKTGYVASVVGMSNYQKIAKDEISALRKLLTYLEGKNSEWIIRPDYETTKPQK